MDRKRRSGGISNARAELARRNAQELGGVLRYETSQARLQRSPELGFGLDRIRQHGDVPGAFGIERLVPAVGGCVQLLDDSGHHLVGHDTAAVQTGYDRLQRIPRCPVHIVPRLAANARSGVAAGQACRNEDRSRIGDNQLTGAA